MSIVLRERKKIDLSFLAQPLNLSKPNYNYYDNNLLGWTCMVGEYMAYSPLVSVCPVGWRRRIYRLFLCRRVRPSPYECPRYDTEQSDGETSIMLEL